MKNMMSKKKCQFHREMMITFKKITSKSGQLVIDDNDGDIEIFEEKSTDEEDETNFLESVAANDIL